MGSKICTLEVFYIGYSPQENAVDNTIAEVGLAVFNIYNRINVWYQKYDLDVMPSIFTEVTHLGLTSSLFLNVNL